MSEPATTPVDDYRQAVEGIERSIRPLATSVDGRRFSFQASLHDLALQTGGYVVLERDGETSFGQVLTLRPDSAEFPRPGADTGHSRVTVRPAGSPIYVPTIMAPKPDHRVGAVPCPTCGP